MLQLPNYEGRHCKTKRRISRNNIEGNNYEEAFKDTNQYCWEKKTRIP